MKEDKVGISPCSCVRLSIWFWRPCDMSLDDLTHHWKQNTSSLICWEELEMAELDNLNKGQYGWIYRNQVYWHKKWNSCLRSIQEKGPDLIKLMNFSWLMDMIWRSQPVKLFQTSTTAFAHFVTQLRCLSFAGFCILLYKIMKILTPDHATSRPSSITLKFVTFPSFWSMKSAVSS